MVARRALSALALIACSRPIEAPPSAATSAPRPAFSARTAVPAASTSANPIPPAQSASEQPAAPAHTTNLFEELRSDRQWTGVAVALTPGERVFVSYPRWSANVPVSVEQISFRILTDTRRAIPITQREPYPNEAWKIRAWPGRIASRLGNRGTSG
jgi:hypothetical protein